MDSYEYRVGIASGVRNLKFEGADDLGMARRAMASDYYHTNYCVTSDRNSIAEAHLYGPWGYSFYNPSTYSMRVGYKTGSGNAMSMMVDGTFVNRSDIPLLTLYELYSSCGPCRGSSGGCPGFAPLFDAIKRNCDKLFVITLHLDMAWAIQYAPHNRPQSGYFQLNWADRLTVGLLNRIRKRMVVGGAGLGLGAGNCAGCRPKFCVVRTGGTCPKPTARTFSCEAVGVDVDRLHLMLYGEYLPWRHNGLGTIPTYMSRYAMFFVKHEFDYVGALRRAVWDDRSVVNTAIVPDKPLFYSYLQEVPKGVHVGYKQYVYDSKQGCFESSLLK